MTPLDSMALWHRTLAPQGDPLDARREVLRQAFLGFRERVAALVQTVGAELPNLTVHDISHVDALWRVADQIAGPDYPINPAEAFVLGGTFLLHDAAHVMGSQVRVTTRRFERSERDDTEQWLLTFEDGAGTADVDTSHGKGSAPASWYASFGQARR